MKSILILILVAALAAVASGSMAQTSYYAQGAASDGDKKMQSLLRSKLSDPYNNTWNIGSAKKLEGSIYLLEVWVTPPGTKWDFDQMLEVQRSINDATDWLTAQAAQHGKSVRFVSGSFRGSDNYGIKLDNLPFSYAESSTYDQVLPRALSKIGYNNVVQCFRQLTEHFGCQQVCTLVLINGDGWACSNIFSVGHNMYGYQNYFLENTYVYRTFKGKPIPPQTIAHELLHQFGAWDMYEGQVSAESAKWAEANYPNEIMLQISQPLSKLMISPLTAWLVGLSDVYQSWYWKFTRVADSYVNE